MIPESETEERSSRETNPIFRYKFSETFAAVLYEFSKIHQYDDRETFKQAWTTWLEENNELVSCEIKRLTDLGYDGNILNKMYKSSRYYFRKKSTEKKAPVERRPYICVSENLLSCIDDHVSKTQQTKPAVRFIEFCQSNTALLQEEVKLLCNKGLKDPEEIKEKIKKTYKNRYFIANSSNNSF